MKRILITGGAGYIGSHTVVELINDGYDVVVLDNLANSSQEALRRAEEITGKQIPFYEVDCADKAALGKIFDEHEIDAVIHFAGHKAVGESVQKPLLYYRNNLDSTLALCEIMEERGVRQLIFSSSATVYGTPQELPLREDSPKGQITNPYGHTKSMIEQILGDLAKAKPDFQITALRYFNPIGAHKSGKIGENPNGTPNNLLPYICQVAVGKRDKVRVFGDDYNTPDGTGVRDYIHVIDLARGHVAALKNPPTSGEMAVYNLGAGQGVSVLELITAFESASGQKIPYEITERRPGDIDSSYADPTKANRELNWKTTLSTEDACRDAWRWQSQNPNGYESLKT